VVRCAGVAAGRGTGGGAPAAMEAPECKGQLMKGQHDVLREAQEVVGCRRAQ